MLYLDTVCKKLNPVYRIMIRFRHRQERICNLGILLICCIVIDIFFFYDFFNIRRIRQIVQKARINCSLAVNTLLRLFHNGLHVFKFAAPDHGTLPAVTVKCKYCHRHQTGDHQKDRQFMTVFHVFEYLTKSVHPLRFLSCMIPDCFRNIPGNSCRNKKHLQNLHVH